MTRDNKFKFVMGISSRVWGSVSVIGRISRISRISAGVVIGTGATS